jgi:hypothetical protein
MRAQNITFQDGTVQQSASQMQPAWSQFGQNWKQVATTNTSSWTGTSLSYSGQYHITVANSGLLYVSSNYGQTWISITTSNGLSSNTIGWIGCSISSSGQYMAACYQSVGTIGGVYISSNYGQTWNYIQVANAYFEFIVMSSTGQYMTIVPVYNSTGYVYISSNYGQSWTQTSQQLSSSMSLAVSYSGQYQVTSSTTSGGITTMYVSSNYGQTWTVSYASIIGWANGAAMSASGQYMTFIINQQAGIGIYVSSNYGQSWIQSFVGSPNSISMSASGQYQLASTANSIYVSINYGQSWSTITTPGSPGYISISGSGIYSNTNIGTSFYQSIVPSYQPGPLIIGYTAYNTYTALCVTGAGIQLALLNSLNTNCQALFGVDTGGNLTILPILQGVAAGNTYFTGPRVGINTSSVSATLTVNGSVSKSSGTFDISHPLYLGTKKRLVHSFIEGPRCDLIYRGTKTLVNGIALIDINKECTSTTDCAMDNGTFEVLCTNPQLFLQNMSGFDVVKGQIVGGNLSITSNNQVSSDTISWMIIAERKDPFIKEWDRTNPDGFLITQYTSV